MAQTSLEWLIEQMTIYADMVYNRKLPIEQYHLKKQGIIEQAKEMHKNEIIEAYIYGDNGYGPDNGIQESSAIDYYKETFNL